MERRLAAIVAIDVAGYSRLMGLDETGTLASFKAHRRDLIDQRIAANAGRIVKLMGDGMLVEFPSVVNAVACASEIQRAMLTRNESMPEDRRIELRVGVNLGDIIIEDGDIFGDGVNVASRLEAISAPGGIAISATVRDHLGERLELAFEDLGEHLLKIFLARCGSSMSHSATGPVLPSPGRTCPSRSPASPRSRSCRSQT